MKRKLGLDYGDRSLGVAISDPSCIIALGVANFKFNEPPFREHLHHLTKILEKYDVDEIVLGLPLHLNGNESETSLKVRAFARLIIDKYPELKITFADESFTTQIAQSVMIQAKISRKKRKYHKDKLAAQLILQQHLDRLKG